MKTLLGKTLRSPVRTLAFTLVEMVIGVGLSTLLAVVGCFLTVYGARTFLSVGHYIDLDEQSRNAVDIIGREIRNSSAVVSFQTNLPIRSLTLTNDSSFTSVTLTYDQTARTLVMTKTGQSPITNLVQCDKWNFALYDRAPDTNSFSTNIIFFPATNSSGVIQPDYAKLVNMNWKCSRTMLGWTNTTESVQTAQIVLRNKVK